MIDAIPPGLLDNVGTVGVVLLVGWLVFTGRLVPRRTYDDQVHEANEWRTESRIKDQQIAEKDVQLRYLAEVGKTVEQAFRGLQDERERDRQ